MQDEDREKGRGTEKLERGIKREFYLLK